MNSQRQPRSGAAERSMIVHMRDNIKELNRSMQSIEKMIEKSRSLIRHSRQSSLSQRDSKQLETREAVERKQESHRVAPLKVQHMNEMQRQESQSNRNPIKKLFTHGLVSAYKTQGATVGVAKASPRSTKNQLKFNTNSKGEANFRKAYQTAKKLVKVNQTTVQQRVAGTSKQRLQNGNNQSPYRQVQQSGRKVFKFSPQKTKGSQVNTAHKLIGNNPERNNKIKLKPTHQYSNSTADVQPHRPMQIDLSFLNKTLNSSHDMIRIEDDSENIPDELTPINTINRDDQQMRYRTEYEQEEPDFEDLYKMEEPNRTQLKKPPKRKINLKLFDSAGEPKKDNMSGEGKEKQFKNNLMEPPKSSKRYDLVRQLQQLQTQSENEEERRQKFMLKIKKYGFVQKYLSEQQIWNIYHQLVASKVAELKWPIYIVDEVYKRMKIAK